MSRVGVGCKENFKVEDVGAVPARVCWLGTSTTTGSEIIWELCGSVSGALSRNG